MNKYKTKLEEEKNLLEEELNTLGIVDKTGDWEATPDKEEINQEVQDEADLSERAEEYEEKSQKLNHLEERLANVNKALQKIENRTYGICEICGSGIEEDRLEVNPAATTCKKCINKIE